MSRNYMNKILVDSLNNNSVSSATRRDPDNLTSLIIIGFAGLATILILGLGLFCIMALA